MPTIANQTQSEKNLSRGRTYDLDHRHEALAADWAWQSMPWVLAQYMCRFYEHIFGDVFTK